MKTVKLGYIQMSDWTGVKTSRLFPDYYYKDPTCKKEIDRCNKDEIILPKGKTYTLTITYPLTTPFKIEFNTKKKALNRKEVVNYIVECYKNIYKIEDESGFTNYCSAEDLDDIFL